MLDFQSGAPWEKVTLTAVGRDAAVFEGQLGEAKAMAETAETGKTIVYTNWGTEWRPFGHPRRKRAMSSESSPSEPERALRAGTTTAASAAERSSGPRSMRVPRCR